MLQGFGNKKTQKAAIITDAIILYFCYKDKRTPASAKILSLIAIALAFSPVDLIPDFIPVLGQLDDIIIIPVLIYLAFRLIPSNIIEENRILSENSEIRNNPVFRSAGIIITAIWITLLIIILHQLLKKYIPSE